MNGLPKPSPLLPYDVAAGAQASVDEEITRRIQLLCDLRTQRNSFSPIFRLAPETLGLIFIHGARNHYENEKWGSYPRVPDWVNVSYVCRHWRDVAVKCPTLWSYHFIVSPRWTDELLARSKQVSLKICIFHYGGKGPRWWLKLVAKLMKHVERIQELRLSLPAQFLPTMFLRGLRLEILEIAAIKELYDTDNQPLVPFDGDTPVLRTLKVSDHGVSLRSLTLGGLTTLSLCRIPPPFKQNLAEFLVVLSRMQDLTYLYLEDCFTGSRGFVSDNVPLKFTLPRLARLLVIAPLPMVVAFLSCVTVPLNTEVRLHLQSASMDDFAPISEFLTQRIIESKALVSPDSSIRSLVIDHSWDKVNFMLSTLERGFSVHSRDISELRWGCGSPLIIGVGMSSMVREAEGTLSVIRSSIPSKDIRSLHIINPPSLPTFWRESLSHLQELRHIKLSQGMMPDLASALSVTVSEPMKDLDGHTTGDGDQNMLVPALEELELNDIQFWNEYDADTPAEVQSLCAALSSRKESRGQLTISGCNVKGGRRRLHFDMVGEWANGCFDTQEEDYETCYSHSDANSEDSENDGFTYSF